MKNNLANQDIKTDKPLAMSYEALKADRDAQQKRADALAVRNEQLMAFVTEGFNIAGQGGSWCGGDIQELGEKLGLFARETYQPVLHGYHCGHEAGEDSVYVITKSATSAALAAIEARGVEKAAEKMQESGAQTFGDCYIALVKYAAELREAK
ncbi:hypothetical protein [Serratia sarumanii]|uniref:hypothetical protein n=1 Tax=Serratia sarumanii TaxID=3020826 RepID=UPI003F803DE0